MERPLDLLRDVLDHTIVDAEGTPCGMVDDLLLDGGPGQLKVTALLVGPGPLLRRLPRALERAASALFGRRYARVLWSEIESIGATIRLRSPAAKLGLGRWDRKVGRWLSRMPGS
jgi:sporulation protein YlmC with PRC-barrel domain